MATASGRPTKAQRHAAAREEAARLRAEAEQRARRTRMLAIGGLALAVVALVVVVVLVLSSEEKPFGYRGEPGSVTLADVATPAGADDDGGVPVGPGLVAGTDSGEGAVVVEVVFDYRCSYCALFEAANSPDLTRLADEGKITLVFRPVSFLDRAEGSRQYSTRAATAAAIVADRAPEHYVTFHEALMAQQPGQGEGRDDEDIAAVARAADVPEDVVGQLTETVEGSSERTFARWVFAATERGSELLGRLTTPSVLINGERWPAEGTDPEVLYTAGPLRAAIEDLL